MSKSSAPPSSIDSVAWDVFARHQAFFHILSDPSMIDPDASQQAEFWSSGERDVKALAEFGGLQPVPGTGVDFGCGLGRLTRALRSLTAQQTGLDISAGRNPSISRSISQAITQLPDCPITQSR